MFAIAPHVPPPHLTPPGPPCPPPPPPTPTGVRNRTCSSDCRDTLSPCSKPGPLLVTPGSTPCLPGLPGPPSTQQKRSTIQLGTCTTLQYIAFLGCQDHLWPQTVKCTQLGEVQYSTVQYSTIQQHAIQHSTAHPASPGCLGHLSHHQYSTVLPWVSSKSQRVQV